jgi:O-methyltransferase domain
LIDRTSVPADTPADMAQSSAHARMLALTYSGLVLHFALYAAARLGVADAIADGTGEVDEIARRVGGSPDATYRFLRLLASEGVLREREDRTFELTELGSTLRSDAEDSMRGWVLFSGSPHYLAAWQEIVSSIQTGDPAWEKVHGAPFFDYLAAHADLAAGFDAAMTSLSSWEAGAVIDSFDFSSAQTIVDVGGGEGLLLARILLANPRLQGVLFDKPETVAKIDGKFGDPALAGRVTTVGGDFFASVPPGADLYILKYVIHDWDDDRAVRILTSCREAMAPGGRVLLVETVIPGSGESHYAKQQDLEMLVLLGSRERTDAEYEQLLARAGLRLDRLTATGGHLSIVEARAST